MSTRGGQQRIPRPDELPGRAGRRRGRTSSAGERRLSLVEVRRRLRRSPPGADPISLVPDSVAAAVLVPLFEVDGEAHVLFIKRPETMSTHQGEIAFPGGKIDPAVDADVRAAALREAHEEIGLEPASVEVVARARWRRDRGRRGS